MVDTLFNYALLKALLVEDLEIPLFVEGESREFTVQCCIRGYHIYQTEWKAEIGAQLNTIPDKRPGALVEDKYAIAVRKEEKTVGHVPKFLSKLTFYFMKNGGNLFIKVIGPRRYSADLKQGGLELPAEFRFTTSNQNLLCQMKEKTLAEIKKFEEDRAKAEEAKKKKKTKTKNVKKN